MRGEEESREKGEGRRERKEGGDKEVEGRR